MAKVYVFRGDDLSPWQFYYDRLVGCRSIYNHPAYVAFLASVYGDPAELFVYDEGDRCVYYPYFKRALDKLGLKVPGGVKLAGRVDFHSSWYYGGPLPSAADLPSNFFGHFVEAFADHAQRAGCVTEFIRFDPNLQNQRLYPLATVSFNRESVYVDLAGRTAEAIWKEFDPTGRYEVKRARREGIVTVPRGTDEAIYWSRFAAIYADEMERKNAPARLRFDEAFFHHLRATLPSNLCLLTAMKGEDMLGAGLIIFDEQTAYIFLSASTFAAWGLRVNYLISADAIFWALDHGKSRYDLQGGRPGVFAFKSHFSPRRGRFHTLKAVHDKVLFDLLVAHNKPAAGAGDAGPDWFPSYVR